MKQLKISRAHILGLSMGGAHRTAIRPGPSGYDQSLVLVSTLSYIDEQAHRAFTRLSKSLKEGGYPAFFDEVVKLASLPSILPPSGADCGIESETGRHQFPGSHWPATDACLAFNLKNEIAKYLSPRSLYQEEMMSLRDSSGRANSPLHPGIGMEDLEGVGHNLYIEKGPQLVQVVLDFWEKR